MRKMFVMQGPPGSGKTTFLRENGFDAHAVGFDMARHLLSGPHPTLDDGVEGVSLRVGNDTMRAAVDFINLAVRTRCSRGETVFVDSMLSTSKELRRWREIAAAYDYELIVVDLLGDLDDEDLLRRNATREPIDRMSPDIVVRNAKRVRDLRASGAIVERIIAPTDVDAELIAPTADFRDVDRVLVVGDVQGCGTALDALIEQVEPGPADVVVLVGDLFDRGVENDRVYRTVTRLQERTRVIGVIGNHDRHLLEVLAGTVGPSKFRATRESISQLTAAGIADDEIIALYRSMTPYLAARFALDAELWITHGGIVGLEAYRVPPAPARPLGGYRTGLLPDRFFEYGSGTTDSVYAGIGDYTTDIDAVFAQRYAGQGVLAFHGHRETPKESGGGISFGLESSVEWDGGVLSAALVTRGPRGTEVERIAIDNPVTAGPKIERGSADATKAPKVHSRELLAALRSTDLVRELQIEPGLSSFQFTKDAFFKQEWNELTTTARGLFLDTDTGAVVGRGYSKFFNIGERPETELDAVLERFGDGSDVRVEHKLNGFLGLAFVHGGTLRTYTKSGPSAYADVFRQMLIAHLGEQLDAFTDALAKARITLTFEVLAPEDPHIVDDGAGVVLLHAIARTTQRLLLLEPVADRFAQQYRFRRPETVTVAGVVGVRAAIEDASTGDSEGVVLRHLKSGDMVKVKSASYSSWKSVRYLLTQVLEEGAIPHAVRYSRSPEAAAVREIVRVVHEKGKSVRDLAVQTPDGREVDIPALRALVGEIPEVLTLVNGVA